MRLALDLFSVCAITLGALFFLAGTLGLLRFPDTLTRLHALTKADNLGLGLVVLGLLPQVSGPLVWLGLVAVWLMALLSGATVGQVLARALRSPGWDPRLDRAQDRARPADDGDGVPRD